MNLFTCKQDEITSMISKFTAEVSFLDTVLAHVLKFQLAFTLNSV